MIKNLPQKLLAVIFTALLLGTSVTLKVKAQSKTAGAAKVEPIERTIRKIEQLYSISIIYDKSLLQGMQTQFNLDVYKGKPVEDVLKALLYSKKLLFLYIKKDSYAIVKNDNVNLAIDNANGYVANQGATAPSVVSVQGRITIQGKVTDDTGSPLPGVTILAEGSKAGVTSSSDGTYSITFLDRYKALVFSFIGMLPQRVELTNSNRINVALKFDQQALKEVEVLSTGYQKLPRERATGSFGYLSATEIEKTPAVNPMERFEGKVPGVKFDIRNNSITIRGVNTYNGTTASQPLIVLDGFPLIDETNSIQSLTGVTNTTSTGFAILSRINPNDIESITFLKDAAAASIWGSRAANGVIVIETKKGRKKDPTINFNANVGTSAPADLSKLNTMTSAQYVDLEQEMFNKGYIADPLSSTLTPFNYTGNNSEATEWMFRVKRGTATAAQRDSALAVLSGRSNQSQINKYLLQRAVTQQYNLSISGGGDNNTYYVSANSTNDRPVFKSNEAQSYNLTANTTNEFFNKRISVSTGITYYNTYSSSNTAASVALGTSTLGLRPYDMLVDNSGNSINRSVLYRPEVINNFTSLGYLPWTYNSIDELNYSNGIVKENRVRLNASVKAKIFNWLDFSTSGSYQNNISDTKNEDELNSYNARTLINTYTTIVSGKPSYGIPLGGINRLSSASSNDYSVRGQFDIHQNWKGIHQLNVIAGTEIRQQQSTSNTRTLYGFNDDTYSSTYLNATGSFPTVYGYSQSPGYSDGTISIGRKRYLSYYSNASYTFLNRYTASASIRFDDASIQGATRRERAIPLYSAGLKWNVMGEDFMKNIKPINALSLRLTYGTGGAIPTGGFNTVIVGGTNTDSNTGKSYTSISTPANNELSWETTKQFNEGIDLTVLNNRLSVTFDVFQKRSYGILANLPFDATYGWSTVQFNAGTLSSHGVEFGVQGAILKQKNWGWNSNFTFSYSTNVVSDARFTKSTSISLVTSSTPINGYSTDYLFVYRWAGLDNTGQSQIYDKNGNIVKSTTGNGALTSEDLKYAGRKTPPYFGGWGNDFRYKNFTLNVMMTYYMGHKFLKYSIGNYPANSTTTNTYTGVLGTQSDLAYRWKVPGDEATTNVPGLGASTNSITRYQYSDFLVRSASNIRLQQIALSYSLPQKIVSHTPFKSLSGSFSARNLGLIWRANKDGIDPDYINTASYGNLPPTKNFVLGINASF